MHLNWPDELPVAITVTDRNGTIVEMNKKSAEVFARYGGKELIGNPLKACHLPASQTIIERLESETTTNVYTIEKNGVHKLIYQTPWFIGGEYAGLVEFSFVIPEKMPHFIR